MFAAVKKRLLLLCYLILLTSLVHAQQRDELRLISSSHSRLNASTGHMMNYIPVYEHHGSTLKADSGYLYNDDEGRQYFDAFGHVTITQPNGTVIFADKLHYDAETQLATLTNNVRMVDGDAVLTTNYLTYNLNSHVGTYTGGGRIVNKTDTITSRNAYYFDNTKDAYFRYDVVVRTPDVKIYTDTMRYNSASKITYFYGPTNIKGNNGENLYTERGEYHTESEQAWFDQNNLYTEGSRFLKGDSLYYDGKSGNGRAVRNVVFIDTADQFFAHGGIGLYRRSDESITMTDRPMVMTVTRNDSTQRVADTTGVPVAADTVALGVDSLLQPVSDKPAVDTIYLTADTLFSQVIPANDYLPRVFVLDREGGPLDELEDEDFSEEFNEEFEPSGGQDIPEAGVQDLVPDTAGTHRPVQPKIPADTLRARPPDRPVIESDTTRPDSIRNDTTAVLNAHRQRVEAASAKAPADELSVPHHLAADSLLREQAVIPTGREPDSLLAGAMASLSRPRTDTLTQDSAALDTAKTRIIKAYYNVRLFKSDLQAVSDSVYYGYPDSMMRFFGRPMIWAQGSQLTADTIFMQIRNDQLDNMILVGNAFIVNTQLDSTKFNQIKGRRVTGFFSGNSLERMFVDGNAESIYYSVDEQKKIYTNLYHSRSSRIKILVDSNEIVQFNPIRRVEGKVYPMHLVPQDAEILDGFVWKPGDRPTSKEDLLTRQRPKIDEPIQSPVDTTVSAEPPTTPPDTTDGSSGPNRPTAFRWLRPAIPTRSPHFPGSPAAPLLKTFPVTNEVPNDRRKQSATTVG